MRKLAILLRAVNVGGTGKLPMQDLRSICLDAGFAQPKTLLASGNVVVETELAAGKVRRIMEDALETYAGKPVGVFVLDLQAMAEIHACHPFGDHPPSQCGILFVDDLPAASDLQAAKGLKDEVLTVGPGVVYILFPNGMGKSKLVTPGSTSGTMRNLNTVTKLLAMLK